MWICGSGASVQALSSGHWGDSSRLATCEKGATRGHGANRWTKRRYGRYIVADPVVVARRFALRFLLCVRRGTPSRNAFGEVLRRPAEPCGGSAGCTDMQDYAPIRGASSTKRELRWPVK